MKSIGELMRQAQQMRDTMENAQKELGSMKVLGEAGGGMVRVRMTCKYKVLQVELEDSLLKEDLLLLSEGFCPVGVPFCFLELLSSGF